MSDQLDPRFARLRDMEPPVPFAVPEAVRRRGARRARRQASLAAVAVVAVTGLAAGVGSALTAPSPPSPPVAGPSASTAPGGVPSEWLLTADDLGPGQWRPWPDGPEWDNLQPPGWPPPECLEATRLPERTALAYVAWSTGPVTEADRDGTDTDHADWVHQVVERYRPGEAATAFAVFREGVGRCAGGDVLPVLDYTVVHDGFTGDESLLVGESLTSYDGEEPAAGPPFYVAVVRVGDAVATVRAYDADLGTVDPDRLRRLAERASERIARAG